MILYSKQPRYKSVYDEPAGQVVQIRKNVMLCIYLSNAFFVLKMKNLSLERRPYPGQHEVKPKSMVRSDRRVRSRFLALNIIDNGKTARRKGKFIVVPAWVWMESTDWWAHAALPSRG